METLQPQNSIATAEVAELAGVHKDTLLRWLRLGLIKEPERDRNGWRYFSSEEVQAVIAFARASTGKRDRVSVAEPAPLPAGFAALKAIDWDFTNAKTNYLTHGIHPYPAKFIPQIPNALIQELSSVGDTVGDIFCGSGTTLVEALTLKRNAVGIDANPLACLIARSKTSALTATDTELLHELGKTCRELGDSIAASGANDLFQSQGFVSKAWRPLTPQHEFWFDSHVTEELAETLSLCKALSTSSARDLALTAFSSIVVSVSKQDSDTRYVRRDKNIQPGETLRRFARAVDSATNAAKELSELVEPRFRCQIIAKDLLLRPEIPKLDLMVCSPPYPNAYSYHLYHRTRMLWLGMDQPRFKQEEIGSHRKYSSNGRNAATVETFREEFTAIFQWLSTNLKRGGYACFVVGDSTLKGTQINNADLISEVGQTVGLSEVARIDRTMQSTKKAFNPSHGKIKTERILILENKGAGN